MNLLEGLKVVDLSSVLAGPSVGSFLAELGADVVKFENRTAGGDVTRSWKLPSEKVESPISAYFASVNFGKTILQVNLKDPGELKEVIALIDQADILLQNFKPSDLDKFNLRPQLRQSLNPKLIHCHLSGFRSAPDRVAYDVVLQAESGFMSMNGTPESGPVKMPVALIDVLAAHQMKEAILLALYHREKTGKGSYITATLEEAALSALTNQATNYLMEGHIAKPIGSLHPNIAPYGEQFTTADGVTIVLAVGSDRQFELLCDLIGRKSLKENAAFSSNENRVINRIALAKELAEAISTLRSDGFLEKCHELRIPAGEVKTLDKVLNSPIAQSMYRDETMDGEFTRRMSSLGFRFEPLND